MTTNAETVAARLALFLKAEAARSAVLWSASAKVEDHEWASRYEDEAHDLSNAVAGLLEELGVDVPENVDENVVKAAFL